jgi:hypothetical protein
MTEWDQCILRIVGLLAASLPSSQMIRDMTLIESSHDIALDRSLEESFGKTNAVSYRIMALMSVATSSHGQILNLRSDRGTSPVEYLRSLAKREIDWLSTFANPKRKTKTLWQYSSPDQDSPKAHIALLQKLLPTVPHIIPKHPNLLAPRLWHPDFHAGNIYIDSEAHISSIIDWQGAWTTPVFIGANPPLLLDYSIEMMMKLPENFKELDKATQERFRYQVSQSILIHVYETTTAEKNPLMYTAMRYPHSKTLKQLEAFAGSIWADNYFYPFEECLISVEK